MIASRNWYVICYKPSIRSRYGYPQNMRGVRNWYASTVLVYPLLGSFPLEDSPPPESAVWLFRRRVGEVTRGGVLLVQ